MHRTASGLGSRLRLFHASTVLRAADTPLPSIEAFKRFERRQTRWNDNDGFGHVNNAIYYQFMDDAGSQTPRWSLPRLLGREFGSGLWLRGWEASPRHRLHSRTNEKRVTQ